MPKLSKTGVPAYEMTVESASSNPYESGFLEIRIRELKVEIRWEGEDEWKSIAWHEIAYCADAHSRRLIDELQFLKEAAQSEGYEDGFKYGSKDHMLKLSEARSQISIVPAKDR